MPKNGEKEQPISTDRLEEIRKFFRLVVKDLSPHMTGYTLLDAVAEKFDPDSSIIHGITVKKDSGVFDTAELELSRVSGENVFEQMIAFIIRKGFSREEALEFLLRNSISIENTHIKKKRRSA
jgi:hypothetical protein